MANRNHIFRWDNIEMIGILAIWMQQLQPIPPPCSSSLLSHVWDNFWKNHFLQPYGYADAICEFNQQLHLNISEKFLIHSGACVLWNCTQMSLCVLQMFGRYFLCKPFVNYLFVGLIHNSPFVWWYFNH